MGDAADVVFATDMALAPSVCEKIQNQSKLAVSVKPQSASLSLWRTYTLSEAAKPD